MNRASIMLNCAITLTICAAIRRFLLPPPPSQVEFCTKNEPSELYLNCTTIFTICVTLFLEGKEVPLAPVPHKLDFSTKNELNEL